MRTAPRYRLLADPTRRRILRLLAGGERTVSEIVARFDVTQPAISKHLRALREAGLVHERRDGKYRRYRLDDQAVEIAYAEMRQDLERILEARLGRLKRFLESE